MAAGKGFEPLKAVWPDQYRAGCLAKFGHPAAELVMFPHYSLASLSLKRLTHRDYPPWIQKAFKGETTDKITEQGGGML